MVPPCSDLSIDARGVTHATTVALAGRGLLIRGASGGGKSALALELMALGCGLVADDRTVLQRIGEDVVATCPPALAGMIEARGLGILAAAAIGPSRVIAVVDLDHRSSTRMPPRQSVTALGLRLPLFHIPESGPVAAMFVQYLKAGFHPAAETDA